MNHFCCDKNFNEMCVDCKILLLSDLKLAQAELEREIYHSAFERDRLIRFISLSNKVISGEIKV